MPSQEGEPLVLDHQRLRHRKAKSREVSSRFLSSPSSTPSVENVVNSPNHSPSTLRQKPGRSPTDTRKKSNLDSTGFMRGLWPSSSPSSTTSTQPSKSKNGTLAECIGNERLIDLAQRKNPEKSNNPSFLSRQRSCTEFKRFENENKICKENHKPLFGASMRYTGKFKFSRKSSNSPSSSKSPNVSDDNIAPGRLSVDETALRRRRSDYLADMVVDSESDQSEMHSGTSFDSAVTGKSFPASYMAPTVSSRMYGLEIPSKYLQDSSLRSRRWSSDSGTVQKPVSGDNSPKIFTLKNAMKRSNSLKAYGSETSKLGTSPLRSGSPAGSEENKGKTMSNMKPPTSPSKVKGVGNLLTMGLELLKGKKHSPGVSSPLGLGIGESVHQLRMFHSRLVQWRYANARAEVVNSKITKQSESNLIYAWNGIAKLQHSVRQKKLRLEREKQEMKLNYVLQSQIKSLEAWGSMERQHKSAVNVTKDCLQSAVCKVPLVEGAKMEPQSLSMVLRAASDLTSSIKLTNSKFPAMADKTATACRELAEIVTQEKLLLEECLELFKFISALEALLLSPSLLPSTFHEYENSHWRLHAYLGREERRLGQGKSSLCGNPAFTGEPNLAKRGGIVPRE
nr:QWRF motif-containing protein 3-like [Coffea arabica]